MAEPEADDEDLENPYKGLTMLAVDDETVFVETYAKFFTKRGFHVDQATNLETFLKHLKDRHHHIILLDYYLDHDKVDGDQLLREVAKHDKDASVLVVTGRPSVDAVVASLKEFHASDYLQKPIKIDDLADAVDRALKEKGLLQPSSKELQRRIGDKIREFRKERNLTLQELADRTRLSVGFLSQIELGKNSASIATLYRIARALGVKIGDFIEE